jgi:hypothetical protein
MVRVEAGFAQRGAASAAELLIENVAAFRWWSLDELLASDQAFSPRALPSLLQRLLTHGLPGEPLTLGV